MTDWAYSIVEHLRSDTALLALVGEVGSVPSIMLEADSIPDNLDYATNGPIVIVRQAPLGQSELGRVLIFSGIEGTWQLTFQIRVYGVETVDVQAVAVAVANALGGWKSGNIEGCEVSHPVAAPTSTPVVVGRIVTAQLTVREN